jgi:hypothetical protein
MRALVSAADPPAFRDFRDFRLPGHDTSSSEGAHRRYIHRFFAPAETKRVLQHIERAANGHAMVPFSKIDLSELRPGRGLFSWELDPTGKRTLFALNYADVFKLFNYTGELHLYEVIPEALPCRLYFDCEFLFAAHPDFDGPALIAKLVARVDGRLLAVFGQDEYELVELDATTPTKFSRHLIFRSDSFCFRSNRHVGHFVDTEILPEFAAIVDPAVYTRNRNFRCVWSTKMVNGSRYPLIPTDGANYAPAMSDCAFFRRTLVCDVGMAPHAVGYPELGTVERAVRQHFRRAAEPAIKKATAGTIEDVVIAEFTEGGWVKQRRFNRDSGVLLLFVEGNRFCHRIGREHKSNHIYIVCRLAAGQMVQKCTDPDCAGFESEPRPIPDDILDGLRRAYSPEGTWTSQTPNKIPLDKIDFEEVLKEVEETLEAPD